MSMNPGSLAWLKAHVPESIGHTHPGVGSLFYRTIWANYYGDQGHLGV